MDENGGNMKRVFERFCRGLKEVRCYQRFLYKIKYLYLSFLKEETTVNSKIGLIFF